ncbi:MAG TPA: HAD family phosphatase [Gammaproteobacteria bacterium]|nr:HAD family phosphatase [Gammaproteobacteria bacterium]
MPRFDLVIFDCDGVVVDSERLVFEVFGSFLRSLGVHLSDAETREQFLGRSLPDCMAIVERLRGKPAPAGALERYMAERDRVLAARVQAVEGIREVLDALTIPYCIASSGGYDKMRITLGATKLMPLFEGRLFSATEVPRAKPAPDIFLFAAERMGASPARTAVIEDSVNGVLAGSAAGMTVFGYVDLTPAAKLMEAGASRTFTRMRELPALLE